MANRIELPAKHSVEVITIPFNFTSQLFISETLIGGNVSVVTYSGNSTTALTVFPQVAAPIVNVTAGAGTAGCIYEITVTGNTSVGNVYVQRALLAIAPDPE